MSLSDPGLVLLWYVHGTVKGLGWLKTALEIALNALNVRVWQPRQLGTRRKSSK